MNEIEKLLAGYEADVDFPDVSGMEHVQTLVTRSKLYELARQLNSTQKQRLLTADQKLLKQASLFFSAIQSIADLPKWRQMQGVTPDEWWWYLDVLTKLPDSHRVPSGEEKVPLE